MPRQAPEREAPSPVRLARARLRLTREQVAVRADVSLETVGRVERERHVPTYKTQRALAKALETEPAALWPGDGDLPEAA